MTDYAEIRGTPDDLLYLLRLYCRAEQQGRAGAVVEDLAGLLARAQALDVLDAAGIEGDLAHDLLDYAAHEAQCALPELDTATHRALGALRVVRLVSAGQARLARHREAA